jgi:hypothetical protein
MRLKFRSTELVNAPGIFRFVHYHWPDQSMRPTLREVLRCWDIGAAGTPTVDWDVVMESGKFDIEGDTVVVDIQ